MKKASLTRDQGPGADLTGVEVRGVRGTGGGTMVKWHATVILKRQE